MLKLWVNCIFQIYERGRGQHKHLSRATCGPQAACLRPLVYRNLDTQNSANLRILRELGLKNTDSNDCRCFCFPKIIPQAIYCPKLSFNWFVKTCYIWINEPFCWTNLISNCCNIILVLTFTDFQKLKLTLNCFQWVISNCNTHKLTFKDSVCHDNKCQQNVCLISIEIWSKIGHCIYSKKFML